MFTTMLPRVGSETRLWRMTVFSAKFANDLVAYDTLPQSVEKLRNHGAMSVEPYHILEIDLVIS